MKIKNWTKLFYSKSIALTPLLIVLLSFNAFELQAQQPVGITISETSKSNDLIEETSDTEVNSTEINSTELNHIKVNSTDIQNKVNNKWLFLHPYKAKYSIISDGNVLGHSTRNLIKEDQSWILNISAKLSKYFITIRNNENTKFHMESQQLITDRFYSKTKMTFKKARIMEQLFDWENKLETGTRGKKNWQIELKDQTFDRVSHVIQLRADLLADNMMADKNATSKKNYSYLVSYKGKLRNYDYSIEKSEVLKTGMGDLSAVKLVRTKSNGDVFIIWLCPELNYFPIKIAQYEKNEPDVTLLLESLDYETKTDS